ncbi:porin family protein [Subsaxibacter sp. CAU 1640]|uniref:porin family protein n=1 Tax=Subsaxibacter sp. CAU 1640 TaxID=2933271 RepID=UPI002006B437|nr:porin family protein [Subsaxibacter sp. CAU 1640]MCK7589701.1 porin family protein [Subsaxibacter sp. CAU 1640]
MKKLLVLVTMLSVSLANAQAFQGEGDNKFQVGANLQDAATGIFVSYDYGLGENMSVGLVSSYALSVHDAINADFGDRIDVKARFNANLGSILNVDENFDLYPGLNLSFKNFGGHIGARYFFSQGFGIFTEAAFPIAKYDANDLRPADYIHNQFVVNLGAVFNL